MENANGKVNWFYFFDISLLIVIAAVVVNVELFKAAIDNLTEETLWVVLGSLFAFTWDILYQPIVVLLLSVIAMGNYK